MTDTSNPLQGMTKEQVLYELLRKEYGYYLSILEITRMENEKLSAHQPLHDINPLLKKKKILLSCISEIETAMAPLKKYWQTKRERSDSESVKIKQELANLDKLLQEILELDLISQQILEGYLESLKQQPAAVITATKRKARSTSI